MVGLALALMFPNVNPRWIGRITGVAIVCLVVIPAIVNGLWQRFLGCSLMLLVSFSFPADLGAHKVSEDRWIAFQTAAAGNFVLQGTGSESVLHHPGLGISVQTPGTGYAALPVRKIGNHGFGWIFVDQAQGKSIAVYAAYEQLATPTDARHAIRGMLQGFVRKLVLNANIEPTVEHEEVVWNADARCAQAIGIAQRRAFCIRLLPVDGERPGDHAVFAVAAFAADPASACEMAQSLDVTSSAWAGSEHNN
jgi:hypothetical protein